MKDADFFRALEVERTQALVARDIPAIERLHAPEYELISPPGRVMSRERYLSLISAEPFYASWEHGAMRVLLSEGMAVVRYQAKITFPSGSVVDCWHTDVYALHEGCWKASGPRRRGCRKIRRHQPDHQSEVAVCRNIKTLFNFEPPATEEEIGASSLQFVRKLSGFNKPSKANEEAFNAAVEEVSAAARTLIRSLVTQAPPRDRLVERAKARAEAAKRFARE